MSEFKFNLSDRVRVKTADLGIVEGIVSGAKTMLNQVNEYDVHYLLPDLRMQHIVIPEDALADMQPSKSEITVGINIDQAPLDEALGNAKELNSLIGRASRKPRKASRSRKRR